MTWPPSRKPAAKPKTPRRKNGSPEADLQKAVVQYLELALPKEAGVFWSATLNGIRVSRGIRAGLRDQGLRPGVPDLVFIPLAGPRAGQTFWIELKAEKGRPTPEQDALMDVLFPAGRGAFARSVHQVCAALSAWGFPLRAHL